MTTLENKLSIDFKLMKKYSKAFYAKVQRWNNWEAIIQDQFKQDKDKRYKLKLLVEKKVYNEERTILERQTGLMNGRTTKFRGKTMCLQHYEMKFQRAERQQREEEKNILRHYNKLI
jgi:hypothetical protein